MQSRFDLACRKHALSLPLRTNNSSILLLLAFASHLITQTNKTSINARWGQTAEPHHQWRLGLLKSYTALLPQSSIAVRVQPIISSHLLNPPSPNSSRHVSRHSSGRCSLRCCLRASGASSRASQSRIYAPAAAAPGSPHYQAPQFK